MKASVKEKKVAHAQTPGAAPRNDEGPAACEICGQKLERDPESGEYICPACYYDENQP